MNYQDIFTSMECTNGNQIQTNRVYEIKINSQLSHHSPGEKLTNSNITMKPNCKNYGDLSTRSSPLEKKFTTNRVHRIKINYQSGRHSTEEKVTNSNITMKLSCKRLWRSLNQAINPEKKLTNQYNV